jgi:hypothetical protein
MKPIMQRGSSDCLRACLASIFEIPWEDAPATEREESEDEHGRIVSQHNTVNDWLKARGLVEWAIRMEVNGVGLLRRGEMIHKDGSRTPANRLWPYPVASHYVGGGESPRGVEHAVVMFAGEIVHDPHPAQDMTIDRIESIHVYVARTTAPPPQPDSAVPLDG